VILLKHVRQIALRPLNNSCLPARITKPQIRHDILDEENGEQLGRRAEMLISRAMTLKEWAKK